MGDIAQTVDCVRETTTAIAGAVEEQSAVTREITRSVAAAAAGAGGVSDGARGMSAVAGRAAQNASSVAQASDRLVQVTGALETGALWTGALEKEKAGFVEKLRQA